MVQEGAVEEEGDFREALVVVAEEEAVHGISQLVVELADKVEHQVSEEVNDSRGSAFLPL